VLGRGEAGHTTAHHHHIPALHGRQAATRTGVRR
jgi:hypothetical protein